MVIIVKDGTKEERIRDLIQWIESQNLRTHVSTGDYSTIIGVIGDTSKLDEDLISGLDIVEGVKRVSEPFKSANRKFHPQDSIIEVGEEKLKVGHGNFAMIAGPCSVESEEQIISVARLQAPHLPLRLPGPEGRRHRAAAGGQAGDRPAHRHRDHERQPPAPV